MSVPVGAAPWHVLRHDTSFARHRLATHEAIVRHAGSFGQLVGPEQQAVAMQVAHDEPGVVKIWLAPVQDPPSPTITMPLSTTPAPPSCGEVPPPGAGAPQGMPSVGWHVPSGGGLELDEQARSAPRAPARNGDATRKRAVPLRTGTVSKDERKAMGHCSTWAVVGWTVKRRWGLARPMSADPCDGPTAAHTSRAIGRAAACLPLSRPCPIRSN
jgi:hypothetical protein